MSTEEALLRILRRAAHQRLARLPPTGAGHADLREVVELALHDFEDAIDLHEHAEVLRARLTEVVEQAIRRTRGD